MARPILAFAFIFAFLTSRSSTALAAPFIVGADMSSLPTFQARGKQYRDGSQNDALAILKSHGINFIRLRLLTSSPEQAKLHPDADAYNLAYELPLALRVTQAGLPWMLDFFYSDTWADPGHQIKPKAWEGLSLDQLGQRMYEFNRDTIAAFRRAGAMPRFVQVGNEITNGMVWPDGKDDTPQHWSQMAALIKSAIRGIHDAAGDQMPKIVIHIDRGDHKALVQWFFDHLREQQVDFDIIGLSYYPRPSSKLADLKASLDNTAARFGHPVMIVETAFPGVASRRDGEPPKPILGIDPGPQGQAKYAQLLCHLVAAVPDGKGIGVFWWGAEYQPLPGVNLAGYENSSFFDRDGDARPVAGALGQCATLDGRN
jgi:arabinogalactan endo-1,4-beta-galactosidase